MSSMAALLFLALLPISAPAAPPGPEGIVPTPVSLAADGIALRGFVFRPAARGRCPAVICAHGFVGSSADVRGICASLAGLGYVAMALDFRGCGASGGRAEFALGETRDLLAAAAYLRRQPFVAPERIGAFGAGMGGTVALLAAAGDQRLKAVVGFMAPTDCAAFVAALEAARSPLAAPITRAIGGTPSQKPERYRARSPLTEAGKIAAPALLVYGEKDPLVPPAHGEALRDAMRAAGRSCTIRVYRGEGNSFSNPANAADSVLVMMRFLNAQLGNTPRAGTLEACLLRRMEVLQALARCQSAGTRVPTDLLAACDLAQAALEARKYGEAYRLLGEALGALGSKADR